MFVRLSFYYFNLLFAFLLHHISTYLMIASQSYSFSHLFTILKSIHKILFHKVKMKNKNKIMIIILQRNEAAALKQHCFCILASNNLVGWLVVLGLTAL